LPAENRPVLPFRVLRALPKLKAPIIFVAHKACVIRGR
jgi:hypothetical protein